jgi:hypothetical protein
MGDREIYWPGLFYGHRPGIVRQFFRLLLVHGFCRRFTPASRIVRFPIFFPAVRQPGLCGNFFCTLVMLRTGNERDPVEDLRGNPAM